MSTINPNTNPVPPGDRPHAPPMDDEAIYYQGSPLFGGQPERVISMGLIGLLLVLGPVIYYFVRHEWPPHLVSLVMVILGVVFFIVPWAMTKAIRYKISNYRLNYERGFLSKDISTIELWHVEDISFHQSLIDRMLGIGSIRVISHDQNMPNLTMRGIPDARKVFDELQQRIIAVKRQAGVLKLDTGV